MCHSNQYHILVGTTIARFAKFDVQSGQGDDFKFFPLQISTMREITAGTDVKVQMTAVVSGNWKRINGSYQTHMWIQRVGV